MAGNDYNFGIRISADGAQQSARQIAAVEAELKKTQQATKDAAAVAKQLGAAYDLDENGVRALAAAMQQLGADTDKAAKSGGSLSNIIAGFAGGAAFAAVNALVGAVQQLGSAFVGLIVSAGQQAAAFDDARAAASTLTDDTDTLIANLERAQAGLRDQVTTTDLVAASYDVLSSGFTDAADAAEVTEQAARGAIAGFSETATVADALTSILNAYGKEAGDAATIVDQLVKTQDLGKITIDQYAQQIGRAASIAAQSGVSFEEFSAAVATATAKGVPAESAVSGVRQAIVNLLKPTADAQQLLEQFGISNATAALESGGLVGVLDQLANQGATSDQLGKIFSDVDALATVATLAGDNIETFKGNIEGIEGAVGTADAAIEKLTDTLNAQRRALEVQLTEGLLDLGQALEPAFAGVFELINDIFTAASEASDGLEPLIEASTRLQEALEGNPEIAQAIGQYLAELADIVINLVANGLNAVADWLDNNSGDIVQFFDDLSGTLQLLSDYAEGVSNLQQNLQELFEILPGGAESAENFGNVFRAGPVSDALKVLEFMRARLQNIVGLMERAGLIAPETFEGMQDRANAASESIDSLENSLNSLNQANQRQDPPKPPAPTPKETEEAISAYERLANANRNTLSQIENDTLASRAQILENGGSQAELAAAEEEALRQRVAANQRYLGELQALQAQGGLSAEDAKKTADAISQVERQLLQDRVSAAQATIEAQKKAEQERIKAAQEAAKQVTDVLKAEREEQQRIAEEAFDTQQDRAAQNFEDQQRTEEQAFQDRMQAQEKAFQESQQADAEAFQDSQNAEQEAFQAQQQSEAKAFQEQQQAAAKAFQKAQQAAAEAFQKRIDAERDRGTREFDALASEVERRVALANAQSKQERQQLEEQFKQEDAQRQQRRQIEREVLGERSSVVSQAEQRGELELSPLEQARADFEAELQERQKAFQEGQQAAAESFQQSQQLAAEEFQAAQQEEERIFEQLQQEAARAFEAEQEAAKAAQEEATREAERAFEEEQRQAERAFEEQQRAEEAAFKAEQRRLDEANAQRIAAILRAAQAGRAPQARRMGGPVQPGQTYLVGEAGPELIVPNRPGFVLTARETAGLMQAAMPTIRGVGVASSQGVEQRLDKVIGLLQKQRNVVTNASYQISTPQPVQDAMAIELDRLKAMLKFRGIP